MPLAGAPAAVLPSVERPVKPTATSVVAAASTSRCELDVEPFPANSATLTRWSSAGHCRQTGGRGRSVLYRGICDINEFYAVVTLNYDCEEITTFARLLYEKNYQILSLHDCDCRTIVVGL